MVKRLVILGAPGVGKGTQAVRLGSEYGWAHISTGDMLRDAVREGTTLGREAKSTMEKGELVPDRLMIGLVEDRLNKNDCQNGFILDGFPRTAFQAEKLDVILDHLNLRLDGVVNIDVPNEEIINRLSQRLVCDACGYMVVGQDQKKEGDACPECDGQLIRRKDDQPETIRHRLEVYDKQTRSLIQYYRQKEILKDVDGLGSMDEVYQRTLSALEIIPVTT
jgi:adenylate kinase